MLEEDYKSRIMKNAECVSVSESIETFLESLKQNTYFPFILQIFTQN